MLWLCKNRNILCFAKISTVIFLLRCHHISDDTRGWNYFMMAYSPNAFFMLMAISGKAFISTIPLSG